MTVFTPPKISQERRKVNFAELKGYFRIFLSFKKYLLRYWKLELVLFLCANASQVFVLAGPYLGKLILDGGILAKNSHAFFKYTLIGAAFFLLNLIFNSVWQYTRGYAEVKIQAGLNRAVFNKMKKLSLRVFRERESSEYVYRVNNDISSVAGVLADFLPSILAIIFKLVFVSVAILLINYKIFALIGVYLLLSALENKLFQGKRIKLAKESFSKNQSAFSALGIFFSSMHFLRITGSVGFILERYFRGLSESIRLRRKSERLNLAASVFSQVSHKIFFGVVGFIATLMVIKGYLTLGSLGAVMAYLTQGTMAYAALIDFTRKMALDRLNLERVNEFLDLPLEMAEKKDARDLVFCRGKIEFRNLSFAYAGEKYVLENLSFAIPAGSKIAIVGSSGRGKTTIFNLILRFYDPQQGAVFLDGIDLRDLKSKSLYRQMGVALHDSLLFNEPVLFNIAFGRKKINIEEVIAAAKFAQAHDFISNLPEGYETDCGEEAFKISQGQKQRLIIAQAVFRKPRILLLDEAMSCLDSETEEKIIGNLKKGFSDSTLIVVSHRLSTARQMELIYFLQSSSVMDIGTHDELLVRNPEYQALFASQIEEKKYLYEISGGREETS